jgi:hypothetical protein
MFSRFLREVAPIVEDSHLEQSASEFKHIGDEWEKLGEWFRQASEAPDPGALLPECVAPLQTLADLEQVAWTRLRELIV